MLMRNPPNAPTAPATPMSAPEWARDHATRAFSGRPSPWLRASKTVGIILYTDALPIPVRANSVRKAAKNSTSAPPDSRPPSAACMLDVTIRATVVAAIPTNVTTVTRAPPNRSDSRPPAMRVSDPSSGPRNVIWAAWRAASAGDCPLPVNVMVSIWPKAKLKPMNEPKVPMYSSDRTHPSRSRATSFMLATSTVWCSRLSILHAAPIPATTSRTR